MPLTPEMRQGVDRIRDYLYGGGFPDPLSNAEQLAYLFFFYLIEGIDRDNALESRATGRAYTSIFTGDWQLRNPLNAPAKGIETIPRDRFRWSLWARAMSGETLVRFVRDEVFPFFADVASSVGAGFMANARLAIDEPTVLSQVVGLVDRLGLDRADSDTKGDLFEHVLRQIKQAGELGQFRTPRHIIRAIVQMIDPRIGETVYDPAAGTAGFLVAAYDHIRLANSSDSGIETMLLDGKPRRRGWGDKLADQAWHQLRTATFHGNDVDPKMVSLATMNLTLRGLPDVRIRRRNVLTSTLDRAQKAELHLPLDGFDVVLANPPFSGRLDKDRIVDEVRIGTTTATELLSLKYMLDSLKDGGRCGVIVPEGVLFGSTGAHKDLRRQLVEQHRVEAVLSLPGGVFHPLFRRQDLGPDLQEGRPHRPRPLPPRRRRRLQARRQPRHPHRRRRPPDPRRGLPRTPGRLARLARPRPGCPLAREMVVRHRARAAHGRLQPLRLPLAPAEPRDCRAPGPHRAPRRARRHRDRDRGGDRGPEGAPARGCCGVSRWPMVPLGALVRLSLDPHSVEPDRNYPIAGVYGFGRGMISRSPVLGSSIAGRQLFRIRSGQLIYSKLKAFEGAFAIVDERADGYFVSSEFPTFDINEQIADKGFLQWNFRMPYLWKHLRDQSAGTVKRRERLYPDKLLALPIPLPPLGEQRRIVDLLNRAAGIRRLREQALATARNTIPALFLQTFGDPATNPKGWPVVQLGEVIAGFQGGKNIMAGDEHSSPFRILKISAITGGVFRPDESKPAPAGYDPPPEHLVREGDLMITRANTADLVGAVAESESDHPHLLLPDKIWRFVWHRPSPVERGFVRALLETAAIRVELKKLATGTSDSMRNISQKKLKALPIPLPPLDLQRRFAARLADLRGIIAQQEAALAKARDLERALMARLLG